MSKGFEWRPHFKSSYYLPMHRLYALHLSTCEYFIYFFFIILNNGDEVILLKISINIHKYISMRKRDFS